MWEAGADGGEAGKARARMGNVTYAKAIGGYYLFLGYLSLAGTIASSVLAFFTDSLRLDLSFLIWFPLGWGIRDRSPTARKWAIGISFVYLALLALGIALSGHAKLGGTTATRGTFIYWAGFGILFLLFCAPGFLLLTPWAKREFRSPRGSEGWAGAEGVPPPPDPFAPVESLFRSPSLGLEWPGATLGAQVFEPERIFRRDILS